MPKAPSRKTKLLRNMGSGIGKDYKSYMTTSEFNSSGTTSVIKDWKTGRGVQCLSQGEAYWYYILRWDDENVDIREQYPLDSDDIEHVANSFCFKSPIRNRDIVLTTDFLVTKKDGSFIAYSIKPNRNLSERTLQRLCIEKQYWLNKGADFKILFKEDANEILVNNIREVMAYYDKSFVFDDFSYIKHKIAHKEIYWDMENIPITNKSINERMMRNELTSWNCNY